MKLCLRTFACPCRRLLALRALGVDPRTTPAYTKYKMFRRLAFATLLYASLELTIHSIFNGRLDAMYWLFLALHQSMELLVAVMIGYTFRSQPFNILFAQVQQVAAELADQMLPTITTIEVKEDMLQVRERAKRHSRGTLLLALARRAAHLSLLSHHHTPLPSLSTLFLQCRATT